MIVQEFLTENLDFLASPFPQFFYAIIYYARSALGIDTNPSVCKSKTKKLVDKIKELFDHLPRSTVKNECTRFWSNLERVLIAGTGYFQ